jgi:hypothetical protein
LAVCALVHPRLNKPTWPQSSLALSHPSNIFGYAFPLHTQGPLPDHRMLSIPGWQRVDDGQRRRQPVALERY